VVYIY